MRDDVTLHADVRRVILEHTREEDGRLLNDVGIRGESPRCIILLAQEVLERDVYILAAKLKDSKEEDDEDFEEGCRLRGILLHFLQ